MADDTGNDARHDETTESAPAPGGLPDPPESPWRTLGAREMYRNPWLSVTEYAVIRPDGERGIYGVVDPGDNVTIVALDADENVYLVGEFRYVVQQYHWMLPSGKVEAGEEAIEAARRELLEEAGITAVGWRHLGAYYLSDGISRQACHLFLTRGLHVGDAQPEGTEQLAHKRMPLRDAVTACLSGDICDAPSVLGIWNVWFLQRNEANEAAE